MSRIHRAYRALITIAAFGCIAVACADEADPASLVEATQAVEGAEAAEDGEGAMSDEAFEALMASATWRVPTDEDREAWRSAAEHIERNPSDVPPPEAFVGAPRPEPDPDATCTTGERPEDREAEAARAAAEAAAPRELEPYVFPTPADPTRVTVPASVRGASLH